MLQFCLENDKFISKHIFHYKGFVIKISKFYSTWYKNYHEGLFYYTFEIDLNDGRSIGCYYGGFITEKQALEEAKEYLKYKQLI